VVLATNDATKKYWFSDEVLAPSAPVANFTVSPSSGTAPLAVAFSDTSSNGPTSWAWDFGDGATTTTQNPSHTYSAAGTYTVKLTATNAAGSNTVSKAGVVTVTGQVSTGISIVGSQSAFSDSAVTGVSVPAPSGIAAGDVLVASITSDRNASMTTVPAGWTPMVNGLSINSSAGAGARIYAYYHVVGAAESGSYNWTLSSKQKWGAGITAYRGVNTTTPLDTSVVTGVNSSWSGTSLTLPSITTASSNTMLISAVGLDSGTPLAAPPSGWTQEWQAGGGQVAALADKAQPNAGASGPATWTLSSGRAFGGWRTALKPGA
jgi:PKD repeat protein